jgi:hypothetical protein
MSNEENVKITTHESVSAVIYRRKKENTTDPERIQVEGDKA